MRVPGVLRSEFCGYVNEMNICSPQDKRRHKSSDLRRGFTLVELLVVLSIVFLLAALLFPVVARAKDRARQASCYGNLRQIGLALRMYVEDNDERLPTYIVTTPLPPPNGRTPSGSWYWNEILYAYHRSQQVFYCPAGVRNGNPPNPLGGHYGANTQVLRGMPVSIAVVAYPTTTYVFMDAGSFSMDPTYYTLPGQLVSIRYLAGMGDDTGPKPALVPSLPKLYWNDYEHGRHLGGVNMCFVDGHVKWMRPRTILAEAKTPAPRLYGAWGRANPPR